MVKTKPAQYKVVGDQNTYLWLEVLEGDDQGIRVSVPIYHSKYDETLQKDILNLSIGDVCEFELESEKQESPNWRIAAIDHSVVNT